MDHLAAFGRARALLDDKAPRKPEDITHAHLIEMATEKKDTESARDLLLECDRLVSIRNEDEERQHPVTRFIRDLAYDRRRIVELQDSIDEYFIADGIDFVDEHSDKLGDDLSEHFEDCFNRAKAAYYTFVVDSKKEEFSMWLGRAFYLTQDKKAGQPIDPEGDANKVDGVRLIHKALPQRSNHYSTAFEDHAQRYLDGEVSELPTCIERLLILQGWPLAAGYLPKARRDLAEFILVEIEHLRERRYRPQMAASNIFAKSHDACAEQVDLLIARLTEQRETLRKYGFESLQKNESGNATGIERVYRDKKSSVQSPIKRSQNVHTLDETGAILVEEALRSHPAVCEAIEIINSPDVGNHNRPKLSQLQKQAEKDLQRVMKQAWRELWAEFQEAALRAEKRRQGG